MDQKIYHYKLERALAYLNKGNMAHGQELLEEIIADKPHDAEAYRVLAQLYMLKGDNNKALDMCLEGLVIDPKHVYSQLLMGNILMRMGQYESAAKYYQNTLEIDPKSEIALNNLAAINVKLGNKEKAIEYFDKVIEAHPDYLNAYYGKASIFVDDNDYTKIFDIILVGLRNYIPRPENPEIYEEAVKLLISSAQELTKNVNLYKIVNEQMKRLEEKYHCTIKIEEDTNIKTSARMEYGPVRDRDYHRVAFDPSKPNVEHLLMHEFMHLEMYLEAGKDKNQIVFTNANNTAEFRKSFMQKFTSKMRQLPKDKIHQLTDELCNYITLQVMNCPLDLLVEDRIFEKFPEMRSVQLLSLLAQEKINIDSVNNAQNAKIMPQEIVSWSRVMNMVSSYHLIQLFGLDTLEQYKASTAEKRLAKHMYEMYLEYTDELKPGEEYDLLLDFSDALGFSSYFTLMNESEFLDLKHGKDPKPMTAGVSDEELERRRYEDLTPEQAENQKRFDEEQAKEDPRRDLMMAMYMECALEEFDGMSSEKIQKIAMEIAMRGLRGIAPSDQSGYAIPSFPGRDFNGACFLAYYYVSWKITHPEDLKAIGLQVYDRAYFAAKKRWDNRKKKG